MASQMVIPPSNDTLFIRGFSSRHHIDEIRDYFTREGGRNTVEFFKETATGDQLFVALKFESKSIAKDVLSRYDGYEVLGDRITMSWYKDIRKARDQYRRPSQNQPWQQDRYDYRQGYNRGRGGPYRGGGGGGGQRGGTGGGGWYQRGSDYSDGGNRARRYTRSSSHSRSRSASGRSRSASGSRSSSREDRSRSQESRDRARKRRRSASDASSHRRPGRKNKTRDASSSRSPDGNQGSHSESDSQPTAQGDQTANKKSKAALKKANGSGNADRQGSKTREVESNAEGEVEESDANDIATDDNPPSPQPVPPPGSNAGKSGRAVRSTVTTVERTVAVSKRAKVPADDSAAEASSVTDISPQASNPNKKPTAAELTLKAKKLKEERRRLYEDPLSDDDFIAKSQMSRKFPSETDEYLFERPKNRVSKEAASNDVDPGSPPDFTLEDVVAANQTKRKTVNTAKKAGMNPSKDFDPFEDDDDDAMMVEPVKRRRQIAGGGGGDELSRGAGERGARSGTAGRRPAASGGRDVGAVGMTYEKMQLVRQKKEDIEKAYRQDCETFATVTKMLISKDPSLEHKIQDSLRENLKDIGQRCIQELRTFIERLKEEEVEDD